MSEQFDNLVQLMARLRAPDGCPWDRKQTHESLKPYLIEEAYEVLEALDQKDATRLKEELGDLLLQILFHAQLGAEAGTFTIEDVLQHLARKLIRRHPHVFGTAEQKAQVTDAESVRVRWEEIKRNERQETGETGSILNGVPKALPALLRAYQVQARASRAGFDWPHIEQVIQKLDEELHELREALTSQVQEESTAPPEEAGAHAQEHVESEFGDVLFTLVNLARFIKVNPEEALRKTITKFIDRFHFIEAHAAASGRSLEEMTLAEMDALWDKAKQHQS